MLIVKGAAAVTDFQLGHQLSVSHAQSRATMRVSRTPTPPSSSIIERDLGCDVSDQDSAFGV